MSSALNILMFEPDAGNAAAVLAYLRKRSRKIRCAVARSLDELAEALHSDRCDLLLVNLSARKTNALLPKLRKTHPFLPVVVVSPEVTEAQKAKLLRAGVRDVVNARNLSRLLPVIERELGLRGRGARPREPAAWTQRHIGNIVDQPILGIAVRGRAGTLFVNDALCRMFGYTAAELLGSKLPTDLYHPDERERLAGYIEARQSGDVGLQRFIFRALRKDGSLFWVENLTSVVEWNGQRATQILTIDITERMEAERRLAEQEERYREVFERAPVAVFRSDADGRFIETNRAFRELLGYDTAELVGRRGRDFVPPAELARCLPVINDLWAGKVDRCELEHSMIRKDGAAVWVQTSASIAPGDKDRPASMIVHMQDVTERRNAEAEVEERDELYRSLVDNSIQGVLVAKGGKPLFANEVAAGMFGYTVDEILAMPSASALFHPIERKRHRAFLDESRRGDPSLRRFVAQGVRKDGSTLWTEQLASIIHWRGQAATQVVIVDITERKLAEERLAAQERNYREAFDRAPVAICWLDPSAKVSAANPALLTLLGFEHSELIGTFIWDLIPEDDRPENERKIRDAFASGRLHGVEIEHRLIRKDGGTIWAHTWLSAIMDDDSDRWSRVIIHFQDISERRKAERHFQNLVEGSIQGILVRSSSKTVFVNQATCRMFGYAEEELLGADSLMPLHPEHEHERLSEFIERRHSGDTFVNHFEVEALRKDGTTFWMEQLVSVAEWQGQPAIQFVMIDVTERKSAERRLADRERKYRETFVNAPVAMFRSAPGRSMIECNRAFHDLVGYSQEELQGLPPRALVHPDDSARIGERTARVWRGEAVRSADEYRLIRKDGKILWAMSSACLVPDDEGAVNLLVQVQDVTARREAEQALRERETMYRELVDQSIQGMMITDHGKPLFANKVFAELYGYTIEEVLSLDSTTALYHPDERATVERYIDERRAGGVGIRRSELRSIKKDGTAFWTQQLTSPVDWYGKQVVQLTAIDITERKVAEMALQEREQRYRGLVNNSLQGLLVMSDRTLFVNDAFCRMFGYTVDEFVALPSIFECYHPDDRGMLHDFTERRRRGDRSNRRFEIRGLRKDGSFFWLDQMSSMIEWEGLAAVQVVTIDITERKLAEQRLAASARRFREIFLNAPVPMFRNSREGKFVETNVAFQQLTGYGADELLALGPRDLTFREDAAAARPVVDRLWNGDIDRIDLQFRLNCKGGRLLWVTTSASLVRDDDGQQYLICVVEDISRRREAELLLADSERQYRERFESAPIAMYRSVNRKIFEVNRAFEELLGYSAEEVIGRSRRDMMPKDDAEKSVHFRPPGSSGRGQISAEHRMIRKDGSMIWVIASASVLTEHDNTPNMIVHLQDITGRKMAEEQLFQSQKMEALGNLAGGIAHDFNNMLLPIIALTELTHDELPPDSPLRENMLTVLQAANQASRLVKQILTFSRQDQREVAALDISQCFSEAIELLRNVLPTTITVTQKVERDVGIVMGDRAQLNSVIMNLGSNAADAMAGKVGVLDLRLARVTVGASLAARIPDLAAGRAYAKISMRDTGCGIDEVTMEKIFNPFFTTKAPGEGTGLGLAMVHGIVERHSGAIDVTSEVGIGTVFEIYLPLQEAEKHAGSEAILPAHGRVLA